MIDNNAKVLAAYEAAATSAQSKLEAALHDARSEYEKRNAELYDVKEQGIRRIKTQEREQLQRHQEMHDSTLAAPRKTKQDLVAKAHLAFADKMDMCEQVSSLGKDILQTLSPSPGLTLPERDAEQFFLDHLQDTYDSERLAACAILDAEVAKANAAFETVNAAAIERLRVNNEIIVATSVKEIKATEDAYREILAKSAKQIEHDKAKIRTQFKQRRQTRLDIWRKFLSGELDADAAIKALELSVS